MKTFLFQGDSITAMGRSEKSDDALGWGYVNFFAGSIGCRYPGKFKFINRGIYGNRSVDIYQRIKKDIINLKPDYMSLLVGVNDLLHEYMRNDGLSAKKYETIYSMLIEEVTQALPHIEIIILEPFALEAPRCEWGCGTTDFWDKMKDEIIERGEIAKKISQKYKLPFVPLRETFNELGAKNGNLVWTFDGIHPTVAGHKVIGEKLEKTFLEMIKEA